MKNIGWYLVIFGIGSVILSFLGLNFKILIWIDFWGDTIGWLIRFGFIGLGIVLLLVGKDKNEGSSE